MTLIRNIQWGKHCFVYCGAQCDCAISATQAERDDHDHDMWMILWRAAYLAPMPPMNHPRTATESEI